MMRTIAVAALMLVASELDAQAPSSVPRAGSWAAEASVSSSVTGAGGALLRFRNDRSAWLLGLNAQVSHRDFGPINSTASAVSARLGLRSLRAPGSPTRPIVGGGIRGSFQRSGGSSLWEAGLYGEFGVTRFFGQSFSLGAVSELQARRAETTSDDEPSQSTTRVLFDAVRIVGTVYF